MTLSPQRLDKAAEALRQLEQSGKRINAWDSLPNATKKKWRDKASVVVSACLGDDMVVVPREPTVEMLAAAFPCEANEEFSHEDKVLGAAVCLKLGGGADVGLLEGEAVKQAAFLARDYRLMLSASLTERDRG